MIHRHSGVRRRPGTVSKIHVTNYRGEVVPAVASLAGLDRDRCSQTNRPCTCWREINDPATDERATVVDGHNNPAAIMFVRHAHLGSERQRPMGRGQSAGGSMARPATGVVIDAQYLQYLVVHPVGDNEGVFFGMTSPRVPGTRPG
jgi:hypothetical protein